MGDFKLSLLDEVESIDLAELLCVHMLASDKLFRLHVLEDALDHHRAQVGEDTESAEKRDCLLELALFLLADRLNVVLLVECCEACVL